MEAYLEETPECIYLFFFSFKKFMEVFCMLTTDIIIWMLTTEIFIDSKHIFF